MHPVSIFAKCLAAFLITVAEFAICCISCQGQTDAAALYQSGKPFTRWWWFAQDVKFDDIRCQLDWAKAQNFGGVEIAWIYPLHRYNNWMRTRYDTVHTSQQWLSQAWTENAVFAKTYADSIGLGCDFTFGTSWPEGDSHVPPADRTKIFGNPKFQQTLTFTWEFPLTGYVIDHLSRGAFQRFADRFGNALQPALSGSPSSILCESWEIKLNAKNKLWTDGFDRRFRRKFGYDILPFMRDSLDLFPDARYDYMQLLSEYVTDGFYGPFVLFCHRRGAFARAECLGSPTDILNTYALVDFPETEAMLNEPNYSRVVASAATLGGRKLVTCETFTCMYGFPNTYHGQEQTADLKLVADACFANGVNQVFWHGMPYNPCGVDSCYFFATVHVGSKGTLAPHLKDFNAYLQLVSQFMRIGRTYTDVAVYVPMEDAIMAGPYPPEKQRVWVWGQYELRYIRTPESLAGRQPLWINGTHLGKGKFRNGELICGDARFQSLYVDVEWMDINALKAVLKQARKGLPVCMHQTPLQPGHRKTARYARLLRRLYACENVKRSYQELDPRPALVTGDSLPEYWCRTDGRDYYFFFAHPYAERLAYPLASGQSFTTDTLSRRIVFNVNGKTTKHTLVFRPYQSLLIKLRADGTVEPQNVEYFPPSPEVKTPKPQKMNF